MGGSPHGDRAPLERLESVSCASCIRERAVTGAPPQQRPVLFRSSLSAPPPLAGSPLCKHSCSAPLSLRRSCSGCLVSMYAATALSSLSPQPSSAAEAASLHFPTHLGFPLPGFPLTHVCFECILAVVMHPGSGFASLALTSLSTPTLTHGLVWLLLFPFCCNLVYHWQRAAFLAVWCLPGSVRHTGAPALP